MAGSFEIYLKSQAASRALTMFCEMDKGDFFNVINLQNYSWNSKDRVDFRFNIGIALKATVKDEQKKVTHYDLTTHLDEGAFLPDRKKRSFGNKKGYSITETTDLTDFILAVQYDFERYQSRLTKKPCYGQFFIYNIHQFVLLHNRLQVLTPFPNFRKLLFCLPNLALYCQD